MSIKGRIKRNCLVCSHSGNTHETKEEYQEVAVCPKCNGAFVDVWCIGKHVRPDKNTPLLTIELQDESSVPKVFYQGEEITGKVRISFDWETKAEHEVSGGTRYNIEHHINGHGSPTIKGYGLARGKYAFGEQ